MRGQNPVKKKKKENYDVDFSVAEYKVNEYYLFYFKSKVM